MRASGAGDGFGWRRRLRGRRARGRPSSPAALLDRGERRYRERQGKGQGGAAGPECHAGPLGLRPPSRDRPQPLAAEVPPPGRGLRPRLAKLRPGCRRGAGSGALDLGPPAPPPQASRWPGLSWPGPRGLPAKRSPTRHWLGCHWPARWSAWVRVSVSRRGSCLCVPSQPCARRSWSCWDRMK